MRSSGLSVAQTKRSQTVKQPPSAGYSGTPLPRKLGIGPSMRVALLDAPADFERTLGPLPEGVVLRRDARARRSLTLWFVTSARTLRRRIDRIAAAVEDGGLWIAWPKQASALATDVGREEVRRVGLASGLVDYKVCAIDETWSALKFARRKSR